MVEVCVVNRSVELPGGNATIGEGRMSNSQQGNVEERAIFPIIAVQSILCIRSLDPIII